MKTTILDFLKIDLLMIKMWQEKTKLIKLKKMLQKFQKKIFSVEVSEKIFFVQSFYCYDINTFSLPNI